MRQLARPIIDSTTTKYRCLGINYTEEFAKVGGDLQKSLHDSYFKLKFKTKKWKHDL